MKHTTLTAAFAAAGCLIAACESGGGGDPVTGETLAPLSFEELIDPESCKDCHPKHYEQWSASMHAYATTDPVFLAMNKRGQEETGGAMGDFCVKCHAPMAVATGALSTDFTQLETLPQHLKGVTCYFCHNAVSVGLPHADGNTNPFSNGNVQIAMDDVMRGAVNNPVEPSTHKVAYSSFHDSSVDDSSTLCGTCHDIVNDLGLHLERTFKEYKDSMFGSTADPTRFQSCQNCHMLPLPGGKQQIATKTGRPGGQVLVRNLHEHLWPAVDVPLEDFPHADAMRSAVSACTLPNTVGSYVTIERDEGPQGELTVWMEQDAGHSFPSGATQDRRLWLELIAYDENMAELYRIGQIGDQELEEPQGQPHPCMFRDRVVDANGQETHDFWEAKTLEKSNLMGFTPAGRVPVQGEHAASCIFNPPIAFAQTPAAYIDLKLRIRPMGMDVLNDLIGTGHLAADVATRMPTFTVFERRATFDPATRVYGVETQNRDPTLGDCSTYHCLMDPTSQECLAGQ
jgi:hypothetical protein